jgi:hypothetical protein
MRQMAQDIELARNSARMLTEAVSFADPDMEAIEENELIKVRDCTLHTATPITMGMVFLCILRPVANTV